MPMAVDRAPERAIPARLWRSLTTLAEMPAGGSEKSETAASESERLVVEFDEAYTAFVERLEILPTEQQMLALQAVDQKVASMVAAKDASLWTAHAHREDMRWSELREVVGHAIREFGGSGELDATKGGSA
jgi:hypothetical protein